MEAMFEDHAPFIRTDYTDETAWESLAQLAAATYREGFRAYLRIIDDRRFEGCSVEELVNIAMGWPGSHAIFIADKAALDGEHPILCVDLIYESGRTFRCIPAELWAVQNNLWCGNLTFGSFANAVDDDGVFRGLR